MIKIWTDAQIDILIKHYSNSKTDELMRLLKDKSNDQIRWKAKEFKLKKNVSKSKKDVSFLMDLNDPESCYWWGFIAADGCFNNTQIIVCISSKDSDHLIKLAKKGKTVIRTNFQINNWNPNGHEMVRVAFNDCFIIPKIIERFSIKKRKTYNPFNIEEFLTKDRLPFFLCGLIDGDGHVSPSGRAIIIKCHPAWKDNFIKIQNKLKENLGIPSEVLLDNKGWLIFKIKTQDNCSKLKSFIIKKCPYMERKWSRIN